MLKRKIDRFLLDWKKMIDKKPLIISGARQVGKTTSIREFGKTYKSYIEINFVNEPQYKQIFSNGYQIDQIIKEISLLSPENIFIAGDTLINFDEIQDCPDAVTALKPFALDGRFDVICSGSLLGVHYKRISSIPVGFKEDYEMTSLDFEEYLWALGYKEEQIEDIFRYMKNLEPLPPLYHKVLSNIYRDYIFVGGMPEAVDLFVKTKTFTAPFNTQKRIYRDYDDDIGKYTAGLETAKVKNIYRHISSQLAKDNHKFQITKIGHGARSRDYVGIEEWLKDAGIINIGYNLQTLALPFLDQERRDYFRIYFSDHSLYISSLDEEAKKDLIINHNGNIYNGALYESLISEALVKSGYPIYFFKSDDARVELDFLIRVKNEIVPIEVKRTRGKSRSLNLILSSEKNIKHGVKLTSGNIGFTGNIFTFPYSLAFLLKRFFDKTDYIKWSKLD